MLPPRTSANTSACTGAYLYAQECIGKVTFNGCVLFFEDVGQTNKWPRRAGP